MPVFLFYGMDAVLFLALSHPVRTVIQSHPDCLKTPGLASILGACTAAPFCQFFAWQVVLVAAMLRLGTFLFGDRIPLGDT